MARRTGRRAAVDDHPVGDCRGQSAGATTMRQVARSGPGGRAADLGQPRRPGRGRRRRDLSARCSAICGIALLGHRAARCTCRWRRPADRGADRRRGWRSARAARAAAVGFVAGRGLGIAAVLMVVARRPGHRAAVRRRGDAALRGPGGSPRRERSPVGSDTLRFGAAAASRAAEPSRGRTAARAAMRCRRA